MRKANLSSQPSEPLKNLVLIMTDPVRLEHLIGDLELTYGAGSYDEWRHILRSSATLACQQCVH